MNILTSNVAIAQANRRKALRPRLRFVLDIITLLLIFVGVSYFIWGSLRRWSSLDVLIPIVSVVAILPVIKAMIYKRPGTPFARFAQINMAVVTIYAGIAVFLVLSRSYYSRPFLMITFLMVLLWQALDVMMSQASTRPRLVAVPSKATLYLHQAVDPSVRVLTIPKFDALAANSLDGLVVDLHEPVGPEWRKFIAECAAAGYPVYHVAAIYEAITGRVPLSHLDDGRLADVLQAETRYLKLKRVLDVVLVLLAMPIALPLTMVISLLIKLDSPGPVFYWQQRVGTRGRPFKMVKFRSMHVNSEETGAQCTTDGDPRVTRVGRILRRFRLDEVPQLWNVLRGEMSVIGPRPEQLEFAELYSREIPFYDWRHRVKPGITGWAQVQQGYAAGIADTREKIEYDLYYVKHLSFWLDLSILLRTVVTVLTGSGAR